MADDALFWAEVAMLNAGKSRGGRPGNRSRRKAKRYQRTRHRVTIIGRESRRATMVVGGPEDMVATEKTPELAQLILNGGRGEATRTARLAHALNGNFDCASTKNLPFASILGQNLVG